LSRLTFRWAHEESGQILILAMLMMTVLLFSVGIAFNLGTLFVARRTMQEAVDAAAFGGAVVLFNGGTNAAAQTAATTDLQLNGYTTSNATIVIQSPPGSGPYWGNALYILVTASQNVQTPLLPQQGGTTNVAVSATAGSVTKTSNFALMALSPTATNALSVSSSAEIDVTGGDVQVNSNAATAASLTGGAVWDFTLGTARSVGGQTGFPAPWSTGQAAQADPLSGFVRPTTTTTFAGPTNITADTTLSPGKYLGGITVSCGSCTVTFSAGMYVLAGGGMSVPTGGKLLGTGVTFFNTLSNYPTETGTCGPVTLAGSAEMQIDAPTSGYYNSMLIWTDSTCSQPVSLTGAAALETAHGTIYAPSSAVNLGSSSLMQIGGQIIGNTISIGGTFELELTYSAAGAARPALPTLVQ
jgi:hypothetical protein